MVKDYNSPATLPLRRAPKKRLIIIDSNSIIHRAFHALPPLSTKSGEVVGAVYGFLLVFLKALRELQPDYITATFDLPGPTFRHEKFKEYKATRPPTAQGICEQLPKVKEILKAFNISIFEKQGFEADDIIATIANLVSGQNGNAELETIILSGDSDTFQLVDKNTKVYFLRKGVKDTVLYDENRILEKYEGLSPEKLADFKGLKGDPSDNIPGVKGIGEKTAIGLILKFGSLEGLYREIEENSEKSAEIPARIKEILIKGKEQAFLSKELSQAEKNAPIEFNLNKCFWQKLDKERAREIFEKFEFQSLINRLTEL
jgi:DNA polymerase-1